jgi:uncharacterized membrane protein
MPSEDANKTNWVLLGALVVMVAGAAARTLLRRSEYASLGWLGYAIMAVGLALVALYAWWKKRQP